MNALASGIEYHEHRTDQPWTVWLNGRVVAFAASIAGAQRCHSKAHGHDIAILPSEVWTCRGCKGLGER